MSYKLICIDMDGTLLNDEKKVSEENKKAIKDAHDKGVHIAICTGRLFTSAKNYGDIIGVKAPIIASNGAYIREKDEERVIYKKTIDRDIAIKIYETIKKFKFSKFFNTFDVIASEGPFPDWYMYIKFNEGLPEEKRIKLKEYETFYDFIKESNGEILKFVAASKDIEELETAKVELRKLNDIEIFRSSPMNFEINAKGVSKGNAVKKLAEIYGLDSSEVICIGDSNNDMSMIEYAGLGVAMRNAEDEVKDIADYITETNNNCGVAKVIREFILDK
ncbi:Cof-type HAD-IIB family hydrolase [Clostridium sediminicola]|uniref:Cof-type HAD-IIB family hydrolase n=1 Tax=Clostridium sediminicola TaxID=3114879 RepID=UPI0031F26381